MRIDKDTYFMEIAKSVARRSTCIRLNRQYGCVIINEHGEIIATGYNGAIRGWPHCTIESCEKDAQEIGSGKGHFECHAVHAEMNALLQAGKLARKGMLYVNGIPCRMCARMMVNAGISRVVYFDDDYPDRKGIAILVQMGIAVAAMGESKLHKGELIMLFSVGSPVSMREINLRDFLERNSNTSKDGN